jgi:hypothetical protein
MRRDRLRVLDSPAVQRIGRDPPGTEGAAVCRRTKVSLAAAQAVTVTEKRKNLFTVIRKPLNYCNRRSGKNIVRAQWTA